MNQIPGEVVSDRQNLFQRTQTPGGDRLYVHGLCMPYENIPCTSLELSAFSAARMRTSNTRRLFKAGNTLSVVGII